ncbi:MAG: helix-turn-helix transcriptional regulator, partial [Lachnospiraceae bacterium]|nr:helix-turn-helix transcriptional regulator [Lachnospiraceae bacterium]
MMRFSEELKRYMEIIGCSATELSKETGISNAAISRYVSGKREPEPDSEYLTKLSDALCKLAEEKSIEIKKSELVSIFEESLNYSKKSYDFEDFVGNFKLLQEGLGLSNVSMGKALGYDASYISRIKKAERKPFDIDAFIERITNYIVKNYKSSEKRNFISKIFDCKPEELKGDDKYKNKIKNWLLERHTDYNEIIHGFLKRLDDFSLDDYINEDFGKVKVINSPIILHGGKSYYGVEGRKASEEEFMKLTLLSKSTEPIFFYNDLPMTKAAEDDKFKKRYIVAMSMLLKKGLHLNMVHNIDRPMKEMILGMEGWFPMYMTGAISPYYFPKKPSDMFCTSHMTSGSVALSGECLSNNQERGKFYVTTKKDELPYYKAKSRYMLKKAKPLMVIYTADKEKEFEEFLRSEDDGSIKNITCSTFKNMDFTISRKWVSMNKALSPKIHFVIYNEKLGNAIRTYLLDNNIE